MVKQASFKIGEHVQYNGKTATVVSNNYATGTITVMVDGKPVTVDKNDLFGMNKKTDNNYTSILNSRNERIAKKETDMDWYKQMYKTAYKNIDNYNNEIRRKFAIWNIRDKSEIKDFSKKKEYEELAHKKNLAVCDKNSASYFIQTTANDLIGEYCHKGMWEQMGIAFGLS